MNRLRGRQGTRCKAVWGSRAVPQQGNTHSTTTWGARITAAALSFACALMFTGTAFGAGQRFPKMDRSLEKRAVDARKSQKTTVIVMLEPGTDLPAALQKYSRFGRLNSLEAHVLDIPDDELKNVATLPQTSHVHADGVVRGLDFRTNITSGSFFANYNLGLTGAGVNIAVLDSCITGAHD